MHKTNPKQYVTYGVKRETLTFNGKSATAQKLDEVFALAKTNTNHQIVETLLKRFVDTDLCYEDEKISICKYDKENPNYNTLYQYICRLHDRLEKAGVPFTETFKYIVETPYIIIKTANFNQYKLALQAKISPNKKVNHYAAPISLNTTTSTTTTSTTTTRTLTTKSAQTITSNFPNKKRLEVEGGRDDETISDAEHSSKKQTVISNFTKPLQCSEVSISYLPDDPQTQTETQPAPLQNALVSLVKKPLNQHLTMTYLNKPSTPTHKPEQTITKNNRNVR